MCVIPFKGDVEKRQVKKNKMRGFPHTLWQGERRGSEGLLKGVGLFLGGGENVPEFAMVVADCCELLKVTGLYNEK